MNVGIANKKELESYLNRTVTVHWKDLNRNGGYEKVIAVDRQMYLWERNPNGFMPTRVGYSVQTPMGYIKPMGCDSYVGAMFFDATGWNNVTLQYPETSKWITEDNARE